jgi:hypothetical protein
MRASPHRRRRLLVTLAGLGGLVAAHLALSAVGAQATTEYGISVDDHTLHLKVPDGQDDRLDLAMTDPTTLGISYHGTAVLDLHGERCRQLGPGLVGCELDRLTRVEIDTGDGDDIVDVSGTTLDAEIDTGEGDDSLVGGPGDDSLDAGGGNDSVIPGRGADLVSGGLGMDSVSYVDRGASTGGVEVSLDGKANDGGTFEGDNVAKDIEMVIGSDGKDVLTGNDADNVFVGHGGPDVIDGRGGTDVTVPEKTLSP